MKLIIDIPDIYYSACKDWQTNGVATACEAIIATGTPYKERLNDEWIPINSIEDIPKDRMLSDGMTIIRGDV